MEEPQTIQVTNNLAFVKMPERAKFACIAHVEGAPTMCIWVSLRELEAAIKQLKAVSKTRSKKCRSKIPEAQ